MRKFIYVFLSIIIIFCISVFFVQNIERQKIHNETVRSYYYKIPYFYPSTGRNGWSVRIKKFDNIYTNLNYEDQTIFLDEVIVKELENIKKFSYVQLDTYYAKNMFAKALKLMNERKIDKEYRDKLYEYSIDSVLPNDERIVLRQCVLQYDLENSPTKKISCPKQPQTTVRPEAVNNSYEQRMLYSLTNKNYIAMRKRHSSWLRDDVSIQTIAIENLCKTDKTICKNAADMFAKKKFNYDNLKTHDETLWFTNTNFPVVFEGVEPSEFIQKMVVSDLNQFCRYASAEQYYTVPIYVDIDNKKYYSNSRVWLSNVKSKNVAGNMLEEPFGRILYSKNQPYILISKKQINSYSRIFSDTESAPLFVEKLYSFVSNTIPLIEDMQPSELNKISIKFATHTQTNLFGTLKESECRLISSWFRDNFKDSTFTLLEIFEYNYFKKIGGGFAQLYPEGCLIFQVHLKIKSEGLALYNNYDIILIYTNNKWYIVGDVLVNMVNSSNSLLKRTGYDKLKQEKTDEDITVDIDI